MDPPARFCAGGFYRMRDMDNKISIFLDLDGTLLGRSRKLHPDTRQAIEDAHKEGHRVYLCSGRPPRYLESGICREVAFDGMVCCAGGCVYVGDEMIYENGIGQDTLRQLTDILDREHVLWQYDTRYGTYTSRECMETFEQMLSDSGFLDGEQGAQYEAEQKAAIEGGAYHPSEEWTSDIAVQKIIFVAKDRKCFERALQSIPKSFIVSYFFNDETSVGGELIPDSCTKEHGIAKVLEKTGCSWEDTAGFGDSRNDLEMLSAVRIKAASVFSPDELKAVADYIFDDPDEGGLGHTLREILQGN